VAALVAFALLPSFSAAVNMRRSKAVDAEVIIEDDYEWFDSSEKTTINSSAFSPYFLSAVEIAIDRLLITSAGGKQHHASLVTSKVAREASRTEDAEARTVLSKGLIGLAAQGALELNLDTAIAATKMPPSIVKLLRHGRKSAGGANMWTGKQDPALVEKAIANLNTMVFDAQKRLDAKNDECEEFKGKSEQTLDQINSDLSRLGQELSNTARAILNHMGGIDGMSLNSQQAREELEREEVSYNEVRNADLLVLKEREANLAVTAFIFEFSKCPDAPSAAMLQGGGAGAQRSRSFAVQTCTNATGAANLRFTDPHLDNATKRLSEEAQQMMLGFFANREVSSHSFNGLDAATAAAFETADLGAVQSMVGEFDDGNIDGEEEPEENHVPEESETSMLQQVPAASVCGVELARVEVPGYTDYTNVSRKQPCNTLPASCCSCNKYYTTVRGLGDDEDGWCSYVPEKRTCQAGRWIKTHEWVKAVKVCGTVEKAEPVAKPGKAELKGANKCSNAELECGSMHDLFASVWGQTKDMVDELTHKIKSDTLAFSKVKEDINTLLQTQATQLSSLQSALAEASAQKAAQTDEQAAKQKEKQTTQALFDSTMQECRDVMKQILFTETCGVLAVRNNMLAQHSPGEALPTDCGVGEWTVGDCSVPCDDELQGGTEALTREVITMNSKGGVACPVLTTSRKCNQIKCSVDCVLSDFSTLSKCTKECGGGVQSRTRTLVTKPKHGGKACDTLTESQPCNSGSCDRDCELGKWMDFKPCTKACNAGYSERRKRVIEPAVGEGACLALTDPLRLERKPCNEQACMGDEMCNSTIDLVIAIDASGSVGEAGFDILKTFAATMVRRMMPSVNVGVVLFGNGKLDMEAKIISDAKLITKNLESDMASVATEIEGMVIQKGFTNMAQAVVKSKAVLTHSRKGAQPVVLMITDGRPSFKFQTTFAVQDLRRSARLMIVHVQAVRKQDIAEMLKAYASEPWSSNYRHIAGKKKLKSAYESYATSVVADLCLNVVSPSAVTECAATDGSEASEASLCNCGQALCKAGQVCNVDEDYCAEPEALALAQVYSQASPELRSLLS